MNEIYHTADLWGVLRTICIILLVFHFLKIFARMLAPYLLKKFSNKMQQRAEDHMKKHGFNNPNSQQKPEGTVTVEKTSKSSTRRTSDDDYVEYEIIE